MKNKIIDIIVEICEDESIRDNLEIDLIENELLDSLAFITLLSRLEEEFDIEIQPTQISPDTWRSVESIIKLVESCENGQREK